ncbi:MAG: hypothetical protein GTO22_18920 [Gemmatimonadales bacterium]|nr:hypothetical protein [Gemmatimonadales bacterium]
MKHTGFIICVGVTIGLSLVGCDRQPVAPDAEVAAPQMDLIDQAQSGGAIVTNPGEGKPDGFCYFGPYTTTQVVAVRSPNEKGNATLSCHFEGLPPIPNTERLTGWRCTLVQGGISVTYESMWVRTPSGNARVTCQYDGTPDFDAVVAFEGDVRGAAEGAFTTPLDDLPGGQITGEVTYIGRACDWDPLLDDPSGKIALIERGACRFDMKIGNALGASAIAAIVHNDAARGDELVTMGGNPVAIPGVFVGYTTGMDLRAAAPVTATLNSCKNSPESPKGCN